MSSDLDSLSRLLEPEKPRLADQAYADVRRHIVEGSLPPGTRLVEHKLTESLGVSRTPLREALRRLEQDGLIERQSGGGLRVTELTIDDLQEIMGIRGALEGYCARLAGERITVEELDALDAAHEDATAAIRAGDLAALVAANTRFHDGIDAASRSPRCIAMINGIRDWVLSYRSEVLVDEETRLRSYDQHAEIIAALRSGEAAHVEQLVRDHIAEIADRLVAARQRVR
jgi:DNA-binding GntR family transcriptional regulator